MLKGLRRRLGGPEPDAPETPAPGAADLVEVSGYTDDCLVRGRLALGSVRLTDLLSVESRIELRDVVVTALDDRRELRLAELDVSRDELVGVLAVGPRGDPGRRTATRQQPVVVRAGPYRISGDLHAIAIVEPLAAMRRRGPIVPLTDALIEYELAGSTVSDEVPVLIVNLDLVDSIVDPTVPTAAAAPVPPQPVASLDEEPGPEVHALESSSPENIGPAIAALPPSSTRLTFDARSWLASQLDVAPDELELVGAPGPPDQNRGQVARYTLSGRPAGRVLIGLRQRRSDFRSDSSFRLATAVWPGGEASTTVGADDPIAW